MYRVLGNRCWVDLLSFITCFALDRCVGVELVTRKAHIDAGYLPDDAERVVQRLKRIHDAVDSVYDEVEVEKLRIKAGVIASNYKHKPNA